MINPADDQQRFMQPDEAVLAKAATQAALILATDRRMAVVVADRLAMDVPYVGLRRIQFDIERERPATLVLVPESPSQEPQVLSVRAEEYPDVANVLVVVGRYLAGQA